MASSSSTLTGRTPFGSQPNTGVIPQRTRTNTTGKQIDRRGEERLSRETEIRKARPLGLRLADLQLDSPPPRILPQSDRFLTPTPNGLTPESSEKDRGAPASPPVDLPTPAIPGAYPVPVDQDEGLTLTDTKKAAQELVSTLRQQIPDAEKIEATVSHVADSAWSYFPQNILSKFPGAHPEIGKEQPSDEQQVEPRHPPENDQSTLQHHREINPSQTGQSTSHSEANEQVKNPPEGPTRESLRSFQPKNSAEDATQQVESQAPRDSAATHFDPISPSRHSFENDQTSTSHPAGRADVLSRSDEPSGELGAAYFANLGQGQLTPSTVGMYLTYAGGEVTVPSESDAAGAPKNTTTLPSFEGTVDSMSPADELSGSNSNRPGWENFMGPYSGNESSQPSAPAHKIMPLVDDSPTPNLESSETHPTAALALPIEDKGSFIRELHRKSSSDRGKEKPSTPQSGGHGDHSPDPAHDRTPDTRPPGLDGGEGGSPRPQIPTAQDKQGSTSEDGSEQAVGRNTINCQARTHPLGKAGAKWKGVPLAEEYQQALDEDEDRQLNLHSKKSKSTSQDEDLVDAKPEVEKLRANESPEKPDTASSFGSKRPGKRQRIMRWLLRK